MKRSRLERLVEIGQQLVGELDLETLLTQIIEVGRDITGARYGALGVIDADRTGLERFVTVGLSAEERAAIGELPHGRGLLRVLVEDPRPLRLNDLSEDPRSFGFPLGHPPMRSFLGVPIVISGQAWGELYLTDKSDGLFDAEDEQAALVLADWAAVAVTNARLFAAAEDRGAQLERTVRGLEASTEIAIALGGSHDLPRIIKLMVERARRLVGARTAVAGLVEEDSQLRIAGAAGEGTEVVRELVASPTDLLTVSALGGRGPERFADVREHSCDVAEALGAESALIVPVRQRNRRLGVLVAFDRQGDGGKSFTLEDERSMLAFTVSSANSIASALDTAREVARRLVQATEHERGRLARELHDATVQELGALKLTLSAAAKEQEIGVMREAVVGSATRAGEMIGDLRRLIVELRPAALDQIGLGAALGVMIHDCAERSGLEIRLNTDLRDQVAGGERLDPDLEAAAYRIVQEALANAIKHSGAQRLSVEVTQADEHVRIQVIDDGRGFDPEATSTGFGVLGMHERADLLGGTLTIISDAGSGTVVRATLPVFSDPRDWRRGPVRTRTRRDGGVAAGPLSADAQRGRVARRSARE